MSGIAVAVQALLNAPAVSALVGQRVTPITLPQQSVLPAIVVKLVSEVTHGTLTSAGGLTQTRVSIEAWSRKATEALELGKLVINTLREIRNDAVAGYTASIVPQGTDVTNYDEASQTYRRITDFYIFWR